jgi:DNA polymerase-3 subunit delta
MVAIKSHEAERFLAKPPAHIVAYLIFGSDPGLIAERARKLVETSVDDLKDPFQVVRMAGDELAGDPLRLADEANTIPMFGGRRAIWIDAGSRPLISALEPILNVPPRDCTIVLAAGALKRDAALRRLCEGHKLAAAIECYPDTERDLAALIETEMAADGFGIDPDAKNVLVGLLGQDRLTTRSELQKLRLYAHGRNRITLDDIDAIVADASSLALDAALDGAFSGNYAAVEETVVRVFAEGTDANTLLGAALRYAMTLHRTSVSETGGSSNGGYGYRRDAKLQTHLKSWTSPRLQRASTILGDAVGRARREPNLSRVIAVRALWAVALASRSKAAAL